MMNGKKRCHFLNYNDIQRYERQRKKKRRELEKQFERQADAKTTAGILGESEYTPPNFAKWSHV